MHIAVDAQKEYVAGFPMLVALTFKVGAHHDGAAIKVLDEMNPQNVVTRWVRVSDGATIERGHYGPGATPDWYDRERFAYQYDGPIPNLREDRPASIRVREAPRRFLAPIGDVEPGCYTVSLRVGLPADPPSFDVCVRAPSADEAATLAAIRALSPEDERAGARVWRNWMESDALPETLPIRGNDPLAYLRLARFIRHAPRPLRALGDEVFDAIPAFYAPEVAALRVLAAGARDDADAFARQVAAAGAWPEKWLDVQRARALFAIRRGDKAVFEEAILALWDEHHQWARELDRGWWSAHPTEELVRPPPGMQ